ncbi:MAG: RNA polymerase sigma factor [Candidatus Omnitrophica bacterium]|nr:RNA polymerase sigma factor [Candidatus Omnitrophota bacterium]MCM8806871.1 RNA polymerase sigma factor [Candidatus Omnitrophota bacterium]
MENLKENILVKLAQSGNKEAFIALLKSVEKKLFRVASIISPQEADDIIQETFLQAYLSIKKFRGNSSFYTWIYRIMMNIIYKKNRRKKLVFKNYYSTSYLDNEDEELKERLRECLRKLHPMFSEIITLFYFEDYTIKEISELLKIKEGTVKSRLFKAKKLLKKMIEKNEPF